LLSSPENVFDEIAEIVLYKTVIVGKDTIIDAGSFQGGMLHYFQLIAEAIKLNLDDFFTYLDSVNKDAQSQSNPEKTV